MPLRRRFLPAALAVTLLGSPLQAEAGPQAAALSDALQLASQQNWEAALASARQAGRIGLDLVEWQRLRAGDGAFADYVGFLRAHPDWPGLKLVHLKGEAALSATTTPAEIVAYFAGSPPETAAGSLALQGALQARGRGVEALAEAKRAWLALSFAADQQSTELDAFGPALKPLNGKRLDMLLWRGRTTEAGRMLPLVSDSERALAQARIGLQTGAKGVDGLLAAVPKSLQNDPGLAHDRFEYRYDHGNPDGAADLMLQYSRSAKTLGDPGAWADERARLVRSEMVGGDAKRAYRMAAGAHLDPGPAYADLEFLAGYIALEKLHDPKTALDHFRALGKAVTTPISLSRAAYWEGRAAEAMGDRKAAEAAYRTGARYQTAFYGLLSAERLGLALDPALLSEARAPDWRQAAFLRSSLLQAGLLLAEAGDRRTARLFFATLAQGLDPTGLAQLSDYALAQDQPYLAVIVAKKAADRGVILPRAYFPMTSLAKARLPVPTDLALAIARRESEFDETIVSPAGAMGLMQVMPATAERMSSVAGLSYDRGKLTSDAAYNAALGSAYLAQLTARFGPALTLVAAGYNAGPNRAAAWIDQLGDPRAPGVDPIDWIESVPYTETRDYIMRVAESYEIYRSKLAGKPLKIRLTAELKGQ